jgi:hypothetical protein
MVFERKAKKWKVTLQSKGGPTKDVEIESYWSPSWDGIKEAIGVAAAVREWFKSGKAGARTSFAPVSVELVG